MTAIILGCSQSQISVSVLECLILLYFIYLLMYLSSPEDMLIDFSFYFIYFIFRERGSEGKRVREKHQCERETLIGCLLHVPRQRTELQPGLTDDVPSNWDMPARAILDYFSTGQVAQVSPQFYLSN